MLGVSKYSNSGTEATNNSTVTYNTSGGGVDTDSDGLKDWEEALWETDAKNPDTDGDGTLDAAEISQGRNPTVAGPDDALSEDLLSKAMSQASKDAENLSETDRLTREFIRQYAQLQQSGNVDENTLSSLVEDFSTGVFDKETTDKYEYAHLQTVSTTKESLRDYGNTIAIILSTNTYQTSETERDIFTSIFENGHPEDAIRLKNIVPLYEKIEEEFLFARTTKTTSIYHLRLLNAFANIAYALEEASYFESDPVRGFAGIVLYQQNAEIVNSVLNSIVDIFISHGVEFEESDPGYQLLLI